MVKTRQMKREEREQAARQVNEDVQEEAEMPAGSESFADLPEKLLLGVLLEMSIERLEETCRSVPRVQEVFSKFEGEFAPTPAYVDSRFHFTAERTLKNHLRWKVEITKERARTLTVRKPSVEWIKRHLKGAKEVFVELESNLNNFLRAGSVEYRKMRKFIHEQCNVKKVTIHANDFPIEVLVDLFPKSAYIRVSTFIREWRQQNTTAILPKINELAYMEDLSRAEADEILKHPNIESVMMEIEERCPLLHYVEEWKKNGRTINHWQLKCKGTDLPMGETEYPNEDDDDSLDAEVIHRDGYVVVSLSC